MMEKGVCSVYNEYTMPIHYYPFYRAGTDLIELYNKPHIQKFINGNVLGTKKFIGKQKVVNSLCLS